MESDLTVEEKLDRLLSAFNLLTNCIVDNSDEENERYSTKRRKQKITEKNNSRSHKKEEIKPSVRYYVPILNSSDEGEDEEVDEIEFNKEMPNIQEAFQMNNPTFLARAKEREQIIAKVK